MSSSLLSLPRGHTPFLPPSFPPSLRYKNNNFFLNGYRYVWLEKCYQNSSFDRLFSLLTVRYCETLKEFMVPTSDLPPPLSFCKLKTVHQHATATLTGLWSGSKSALYHQHALIFFLLFLSGLSLTFLALNFVHMSCDTLYLLYLKRWEDSTDTNQCFALNSCSNS